MSKLIPLSLCGIALLAACAKEPPPRTVTEFVENPLLLEAAMVRCSQDRSKNRYEAECVNARQAVSRIQAKEEAERRAELEASSERKRRALRRTQQAAAEARRRAAEAERQREEAEYLAQFGALPPGEDGTAQALPEGNLPTAVVPEAVDESDPGSAYGDNPPIYEDVRPAREDAPPVVEGSNAPVAEPAPEAEPPSDLSSIRDELKRRNEGDDN